MNNTAISFVHFLHNNLGHKTIDVPIATKAIARWAEISDNVKENLS
jgi:hypothetical protein